MAKYLIQDTTLTAIGDAIRSKNGYSDRIDPVDMPEEIGKIKGEGVELPELTNPAEAAQIREGYEAIDANGAKIEGEMPTVEMYIDSLSFDKTNGKIIAGATVTGSGYVQQIRKTQNAGVSTLGATTIIPSAEDQVIEKHRWLTGDITIKAASANLPELTNPAGAAQIREGYETISAAGAKITGSMPDAVVTVGQPGIDGNGVASIDISCSAGYITDLQRTITQQLPTQGATTIEPGAEDQVIGAYKWLTGNITVKGILLDEQTVTPGENIIEVTPREGYVGLGKVIVEAVAGGGGGGGSMEGVHTVTFMSHDGTTELYKRPVADDDDCADPVTRGYISAPTKASTVQYDYSFVGWATTPNGAWDTNALKAVTADKTVYAAFASVVRMYTATFYDGNTVIGTYTGAYGTKAIPPAYEKDGYTLVGWTPSDLTIYGDTNFVGIWDTVSGYEFVFALTPPVTSSATAVAISKDRTRMAIGSNTEGEGPLIYDLSKNTPTLIKNVAYARAIRFGRMCYSDDGNKLFCTTTVDVSSTTTREVYLTEFDATDDKYTVTKTTKLTSGDSRTLTSGMYEKSPVDNGYVYAHRAGGYYAGIWNASGTRLVNLTGSSTDYVYCIGYSPDGSYVAMGYKNGSVKIYTASGSLYKTITVGTSSVTDATFSKDNSKLATFSSDGLFVYSVASGEKLIDVKSEYPNATRIYFVDGTNDLVVINSSVSASKVPEVLAFDVSANTLQIIENIPTFSSKGFIVVQKNLDGKTLAFAGGTGKSVEVWRKL